MSSQGAIAGSEELKSRSTVSSSLLSAFTFDHTGSLKDRLLTVLIVLLVAVALTYCAKFFPYGGLFVVAFTGAVAFLSAFEAVRLFSRDPVTLAYKTYSGAIHFVCFALPTVVAAYVGVSHVLSGTLDWKPLAVSMVVSAQLLMILQVVAGRERLEDGSRHAESYAPAFILVGMCAPQLVVISSLAQGIHLIWWMVGVVAINDASAYFAGRAVGKHKMAPALSPNKTVEGSVAGFILGIVAGVFFGQLMLGDLLSPLGLVIVSFFVVLSAQAADLSKSYLKRLRGVKDTGAIFPGHGGVLDRFDGMIGAAPMVLAVLVILGVL